MSLYLNRRFGETSAHIQTLAAYIAQDGNIRNFRCENFTSYKFSIMLITQT
jgi:hypothetical protein